MTEVLKLWVDTETTGLKPGRHAVSQLAYIVHENPVGVQFDIRVADSAELDPRALEVQGKTPEELRAAGRTERRVAYGELLRDFNEMRRAGDVILVGYNVAFDQDMINGDLVVSGTRDRLACHHLDVMALVLTCHDYGLIELPRKANGMLNARLDAALAAAGIQGRSGAAHGALEDIMLTRSLYHRLVNLLVTSEDRV